MTTLPLSPELFDTFKSLSVKKRQGVLEIISPSREYELTFFEGKIIHADRVDQSFIQYLGSKVGSLSNAFSTELDSVGRGEQITRLLQLTELELPRLIEYKKAYDRETLALLAEESSFSFDFRTKIVRCPEGLSLELSPGHYLLDLIDCNTLTEQTPPAPTEVANISISSECKSGLDSPSTCLPELVKETVVSADRSTALSPISKKRRARIRRKPPKAGRFKTQARVDSYAGVLRLSSEQAVMGIRLTLLLLLLLFAPGFLSAWSNTLYLFLAL